MLSSGPVCDETLFGGGVLDAMRPGSLLVVMSSIPVAAARRHAEAVLLAERGGADPAKVREALLGGFADSTILRQHALRMIGRDFEPGGPAKYQVKDTTTAVEFGRTVGLELPVLQVVDRLFGDMVAHGEGDLDHSAIIREIGRRNGLGIA